MVRGKLTRVGQVTKGVKERLESLRDVPGAARQEIALERGEHPLAERGLGASAERRKRVACRQRPAGGGVLRGVLEDVRQGLACSLTGTCRSQTDGTEPVTQPVEQRRGGRLPTRGSKFRRDIQRPLAHDIERSARCRLLQQGNRFQQWRSEEHTSELQSQSNLVCRLLLE